MQAKSRIRQVIECARADWLVAPTRSISPTLSVCLAAACCLFAGWSCIEEPLHRPKIRQRSFVWTSHRAGILCFTLSLSHAGFLTDLYLAKESKEGEGAGRANQGRFLRVFASARARVCVGQLMQPDTQVPAVAAADGPIMLVVQLFIYLLVCKYWL